MTTAESMSSSPTQPPLLVKIKRLQSADKALFWSCFAWLYTMCLLTLIETTLDAMSFDPHPRTTYFTLLEWPPCLFGLLAAIVAYRRSGPIMTSASVRDAGMNASRCASCGYALDENQQTCSECGGDTSQTITQSTWEKLVITHRRATLAVGVLGLIQVALLILLAMTFGSEIISVRLALSLWSLMVWAIPLSYFAGKWVIPRWVASSRKSAELAADI